ncbi:MAG TPA: hypothetical protein VD948_10890, partial [Rhodothermales bacterium]|nr:hypothetical protein [Rhodothermales bacterium]
MKTSLTTEAFAHARRGERGAALVTTLLVAVLVFGMGGALILTTAMTTTTAAEATGESQAYVAAEAGIQATINVLRGNVAPSPLFATNPMSGVADANKMTFRRAITRSYSNLSGDPTTAPIRLSRWLPYSYTPTGGTYADRVPVGPAASYSPLTGMAYGVTISDMDNSHLISFRTKGEFTYSGDASKGVATNNADGS